MNDTLSQAIKLLPVAKALIALANPPESDPLQELKALVEKYGARNSRIDQAAIQDAHDLMVRLGAMCGEPEVERKGAGFFRDAAPTREA